MIFSAYVQNVDCFTGFLWDGCQSFSLNSSRDDTISRPKDQRLAAIKELEAGSHRPPVQAKARCVRSRFDVI